MEYIGYRLYTQFPLLKMRVSSRHDGIRSAPSCTNFIKLHDDSVESVLAIPIRMRASSWGLIKVEILGETSVKETET